MTTVEHKLAVLSAIAERFNKERLTWAVGASLLLYLKGKTDTFHDIDIMVMSSDIERVKDIMSGLGTIQPPNPNAQYKTKFFIECTVEGVEIDIMAGFAIVNDGVEYDCSLKESDIAGSILINGQRVPLHSLERWRYYYELMGRTEKAQMIEAPPRRPPVRK